eukprot:365558-Chlamydomonas_euryale.AAC.7
MRAWRCARAAGAVQGPRASPRARTVAVACSGEPMKVVVTGAAGRTGALVTQKLAERPGFQPRAVVRSDSVGIGSGEGKGREAGRDCGKGRRNG